MKSQHLMCHWTKFLTIVGASGDWNASACKGFEIRLPNNFVQFD